ncbi:MAG: VacJ family lipoprotein [Proteobacteria bacterium]|nr:VacJ family lipoprotein [Pseudomonadota bacterium]
MIEIASGMAPGPHLVLPLLGPTNFRDATGDVISAVVSPLPLAAKAATSGVSYSNNQDEIQDVTSGALDPYIVERESYEQNRRYEVTNGVVPLVDFPEFAVDEK